MTPEDNGFLAAYERIHQSFEVTNVTEPGVGTLTHLISIYKESPKFTKRAPRTKKDYLLIMDFLGEKFGHLPIRTLSLEAIEVMRDKWANTPRTANYRITVLALMLKFAQRRTRALGLPPHWKSPAIGWERLEVNGRGYPQWPDNLISEFRKQATPELRWLMEMALYTGQRGQDVVAMNWNQFDGEFIDVVQKKGDKPLSIKVHRDLLTVLTEIPRRHVIMLTSQDGKPWGYYHYAHEIQETVEECGFSGYSLHGLRKNAVTRLLEAGCTEHETASVTGQSLPTVRKYAERVNQKQLTVAAITKLERSKNRK